MKIKTDQLYDIQGYTLTTKFQTRAYITNLNKFINFITRPTKHDQEMATKIFFQKLPKVPSRLKPTISKGVLSHK